MLRQRLPNGGGVVEEDVDPDPRVGAGDARHVAQRATRRVERLVPVDARRSRLVDEQIGKRVREVARQRDQAVVSVGVDRDGDGADRSDERMQRAVALGVGLRDRGEEPGRAVEELGARVGRPARFGPADRMATDEAGVGACGAHDRALRRADVGDRAGG